MKYGIVANPKAGKLNINKKKIILEKASAMLGDCKVYGLDTKSAEEFHTCANEVSKKVDTLIVAGGDGTLQDVINSVDKDVVLSYLPFGSGNAIKYALGLPKTIPKITEQIKNGKKRSLDLMLCDDSRKTFIADIGIGGKIVEEREKMLKKGVKGRLAYTLATAKIVSEYKGQEIKVTIDKKKFYFKNALSMVLTKIPFGGYGMNVVPKAKLNDGYIHFLAVAFDIPELAYGMVTVLIDGNKAGKYTKGKEIYVETSKEEYLEIGGDVERKGTSFKFKVLPKYLKMRY